MITLYFAQSDLQRISNSYLMLSRVKIMFILHYAIKICFPVRVSWEQTPNCMKYLLLAAMQISVESFCQAKLIVLETLKNTVNNKQKR